MKTSEPRYATTLDDRPLWDLVREGQQWQAERGLTEPPFHLPQLLRRWQAEQVQTAAQALPEEHYLVVIEPIDSGYRADCPALGPCMGTGPTPEAARANLMAEVGRRLAQLAVEGRPWPRERGRVETLARSECLAMVAAS
jgi:predicted RNase H-like HicB family nuclease